MKTLTQSAWFVRPFVTADAPAWLRLLAAVARFDGSVDVPTEMQLQAELAAAQRFNWLVAVAQNGAIVGGLSLHDVGTVRTRVCVAVNPAWRRQGIGRALVQQTPVSRRLLIDSLTSVEGAEGFLRQLGFTERYRDVCFRGPARRQPSLPLPEGISVVSGDARDVERVGATLATIDDAAGIPSADRLHASCARLGVQLLYVVQGGDTLGLALAAPRASAKRHDRDALGVPQVALIEHIGLIERGRGRGLSRPLVRAMLRACADAGFASVEVFADARRPNSFAVYEAEGMQRHDERVHWLRPERLSTQR